MSDVSCVANGFWFSAVITIRNLCVLFKCVLTQLRVLADDAYIFAQVYASSSDSLLHLVCREGLEEAGLLLCLHGANPNHVNKKVCNPFCFHQVSVWLKECWLLFIPPRTSVSGCQSSYSGVIKNMRSREKSPPNVWLCKHKTRAVRCSGIL